MYEVYYRLRDKQRSLFPDPAIPCLGKTRSIAPTIRQSELASQAGFCIITETTGLARLPSSATYWSRLAST